jgi:hypothetical protein
MLKYDFISEEWIVSRTAGRVYRLAAILSLALFLILVALIAGEIPRILGPVLKPLLLAGIVGAAITVVGMEFFLFRFDDSHPLKQIFWFCVMIFVSLGLALCCLMVYSRSKALANSCADHGVEPRVNQKELSHWNGSEL